MRDSFTLTSKHPTAASDEITPCGWITLLSIISTQPQKSAVRLGTLANRIVLWQEMTECKMEVSLFLSRQSHGIIDVGPDSMN